MALCAIPARMTETATPQEGATPPPALIQGVSWARAPHPDFPSRALGNGVSYGVVELDCGFTPDGALKDCRVLREEPEDMGFARSALSAAARARLESRGLADAPTDARVRFSLRFLTP